jgi:signal transduction histidine kinase
MTVRAGWFFAVTSVAALVLYLATFYGQINQATLPADLPIPTDEFPLAIEGMAAGSLDEARFLADAFSPGQTVQVTNTSGIAYDITLSRKHSLSHLLISCISGLFFWAIGAFIFAPRAVRPDVRDFFWCTFLYGLAVMAGGLYFPGDPAWPDVVRTMLRLACLAVLPVVFLHLTLSFPRRSGILQRARWLMPALWGLALILLAGQTWVYLRYVHDPDPDHAARLYLLRRVAGGALITLVSVAFVKLLIGTRRLQLTRERMQVKWLLWGIAVGASPYVFLRAFPLLLGLAPPLSPQVERLFALAIPTAFALAVVRYQFLDIDIIIRRSLIYAILAAGMTILYLAFGIALGQRFEGVWASWAGLLLIALGLLAGIMFTPLRNAIGKWVDRIFFQIEHNYGQALASFTRRMETISGQREVCASLARFLGDMLRPQRCAVVIRHRGETLVAGDASLSRAGAWMEACAQCYRGTWHSLVAPNSSSLPELEGEDFPSVFREEDFVLVEPICREEGLLGLLGLVLLGRRETERSYVETDLDLVAQSAATVAEILERIRLVQIADEETQARRRLDDLNRLKSDFLSRVAHDLRTPLASISWSTENLLDGVAGELGETQVEYLRSIQVSASHLNQLVGNLLEISRLEEGRLQLDLEAVDLARVVEEAILATRPVAATKQVELTLNVGARGEAVRGHRGKLFEVVMNLLDNAVKYSPPESQVEVSVGPEDAGWQAVTVRDHGPGLGEEIGVAAFERFQQGPPSPYSQQHGFGLGLYIVKSYVELMNGGVAADNHPEGGAIFTCRLPADARGERSTE